MTQPAGAVEVSLAGARVGLLPSGAAWLPDERLLLVADLHVGKDASFRRLGVPVPRGSSLESLRRVTQAATQCGARGIVFLGDFLHSEHGRDRQTMAELAHWRGQHANLELTLVRGNHDARAGDPPEELGIRVVDEPLAAAGGALALCHMPEPRAGRYVLAGHWHPCVTVHGRADRLRLPCFWLGGDDGQGVGILPAFGRFTGMHRIEPRGGDRVYLLDGERVRPWGVEASRPALAGAR